MGTEDWRSALARAIANHDRAAAIDAASEVVDGDPGRIPALYDELAALLVDLGAEWRAGTTEVWREHLATGIIRTIVEGCANLVESGTGHDRDATVVLAAPADEYHDLGLRMLADRFTLAGWRAHFLGANVPATEVVAAVVALQADAVALSASTHFHRLNLRAYVSLLRDERPDVRIWVGGPAFAHETDGWPDDLVLDPRLIPTAGAR